MHKKFIASSLESFFTWNFKRCLADMVKHKNNLSSLFMTFVLINYVFYMNNMNNYVNYKAIQCGKIPNLSSFTFTKRISKNLGRKSIVLNTCELSKLKSFNHKAIFAKSSILDVKFYIKTAKFSYLESFYDLILPNIGN